MNVDHPRPLAASGRSVGRRLAEGVRVRGLQFAWCGLCKCVAKANVDNCEMHSSWRFQRAEWDVIGVPWK